MNIFGRIPPQSVESEKSILGSMLVDKDVVPTVMEVLKGEDFYREDHREIFGAMSDLFKKSEPIDLVTVSEQLKQRGSIEAVGGLGYLSEIASVSTTANVKYYADIVIESANSRKIIIGSNNIIDGLYENGITSSEAVGMMLKLATDTRHAGAIQSADAMAEETKEAIYERVKNRGALPGKPTGYRQYDYMTGGLENGLLYLFAARPSMGKTAMLLSIILYFTRYLKIPALFFSLEMTAKKITDRIISVLSKVPANKIKTGSLDDEELKKVEAAIEIFKGLPLYIDDTPGLKLSEINARAVRMKMKIPELGLMCLDHLTEMGKEDRDERIAVTENVRGLKRLGKQINVPVILLAQLSRAVEGRNKNDKRPKLSDLRESGAIEEVADVVSFIYREAYYDESKRSSREDAELIIAKCRDGQTGTINLNWYSETLTFENPEYTPRWVQTGKQQGKPF